MEKASVKFETLDIGFRSCDDPKKLQEICDSLGPEQGERFASTTRSLSANLAKELSNESISPLTRSLSARPRVPITS
jgi:hypothetical protein